MGHCLDSPGQCEFDIILRMDPFGFHSLQAAAKTTTIGPMNNFVLNGCPQQSRGKSVKSLALMYAPVLHIHVTLPSPVTLARLSFYICKSG